MIARLVTIEASAPSQGAPMGGKTQTKVRAMLA